VNEIFFSFPFQYIATHWISRRCFILSVTRECKSVCVWGRHGHGGTHLQHLSNLMHPHVSFPIPSLPNLFRHNPGRTRVMDSNSGLHHQRRETGGCIATATWRRQATAEGNSRVLRRVVFHMGEHLGRPHAPWLLRPGFHRFGFGSSRGSDPNDRRVASFCLYIWYSFCFVNTLLLSFTLFLQLLTVGNRFYFL